MRLAIVYQVRTLIVSRTYEWLRYLLITYCYLHGILYLLLHPFLISSLLPFWRVVRSYRPHLEERDSIWGDDWVQSPFIRRSPRWGFLGVFLSCEVNARRSLHSPQNHCHPYHWRPTWLTRHSVQVAFD